MLLAANVLNVTATASFSSMFASPGVTGVPALAGDLNDDGFVGQADLDIVLAMWGKGPIIPDPRADVNEDDFVGQTDLDYVLADWAREALLTTMVSCILHRKSTGSATRRH